MRQKSEASRASIKKKKKSYMSLNDILKKNINADSLHTNMYFEVQLFTNNRIKSFSKTESDKESSDEEEKK